MSSILFVFLKIQLPFFVGIFYIVYFILQICRSYIKKIDQAIEDLASESLLSTPASPNGSFSETCSINDDRGVVLVSESRFYIKI